MRHFVNLWLTPTSTEAELKRVVKASDVDDAIASLMKSLDLNYAYSACAYPISRRIEDTSSENWRRCVHCSVTGKISFAET